jgi:hypothetical protein
MDLSFRENYEYVVIVGLLAAGSVTAIISALLTDGNFWFVHVLLATLVLSQLLESLSRLYYYRQGV